MGKKIGPILLLGVVGFVVYWYLKSGGSLSGNGPSGGSLPDPSGVTGKAKGAADTVYHQPWFWTAVVSAVVAALGFMTWKRIGGWGRAVVLVCAAIAVTVLVSKVG